MIDTHCHILPDLDDGPTDIEESIKLAKALVADGVHTVIATPHQLGMFNNADAAEHFRKSVIDLNEQLLKDGIGLTVYPGAEVRLDMSIGLLLDKDEILTLADGKKYLLLELPEDVLIDITPLVKDFMARGIVTVVAHAERLLKVEKQPAIFHRWLDAGAILQVSAAGLLGEWGNKVSRFGWQLVLNGQASLLATDAHNTVTRRPRLAEAFSAVSEKLGTHIARRMTIENPAAILKGARLSPLFQNQNQVKNVAP